MLWVATVALVLVLPFLLWPLLRPTEPAPANSAEGEREQVLHAIEEVELDAASGRLDQAEAGRRLAELRVEAEEVLRRQ